MRDVTTVTDFDFYDDGGYNFDIDEFDIVDNCLENINTEANLESGEGTYLKVTEVLPGNKGGKEFVGKKKISASYRSNDDIERASVPKKRGKKMDSKSHQTPAPTVNEPVTPMPNYHAMDTPTLKNELHNFGVRPLPKKKMILKLKEIYDYTHKEESLHQETKNDPHAVGVLSSKTAGSCDVDEVSGSGTASSDESGVEGDTEFGDCTVMIEDEAVSASQQVRKICLKSQIYLSQ
ncbi:PREDICTED: uncharacterized protein LOC107348698 [Acropora digitifera]|uniref:uncharacterized protein LOC107348698 n=1 Tax=Acropora digitifera TaxID=70779 RepID=UPI000779F443|nr:PREDICTED: uncharacterized protein LOC107348698 [Acropora digitifera]